MKVFCRVGHDHFICGWASSFKMEFLAFQLGIRTVTVKFNIILKLPLCACVVAVYILFLSMFQLLYFLSPSSFYCPPLWHRLNSYFLEWKSVELWSFKNFWFWTKYYLCIYNNNIYIYMHINVYCFHWCSIVEKHCHASVKLPITKKSFLQYVCCSIYQNFKYRC